MGKVKNALDLLADMVYNLPCQQVKQKTIKRRIEMQYTITSIKTINIDNNGIISLINENTTVAQVQTRTIRASIELTASQKQYNYITLGKYSPIQLNHEFPLTVVHEATGTTVHARTHKTQLNRFDKMGPILANYNVGDTINFEWDPNDAILKVV